LENRRASPSRPLAIAAVGIALLGRAPIAGEYFTDVFPAMIVVGLGAGLSFVSITTAALTSVDEEASGLASGLLSTAVQFGGAVGVAALVAAASERSSDLLASGSAPLAAQAGGLQLAFLIASGLSLAASIIATFALPRASGDVAAAAGALPETSS
jgi:hypothetical protein